MDAAAHRGERSDADPAAAGHGPADRTGILELVRAAGAGITTAEAAAKTGLRPSTVRSHLDALVCAGLLVKARASSGLPYRPAWRYRPAVPDPAPGTYRLLLAAVLDQLAATVPDARTGAAEVGHRWGRLLGTDAGDGRGATEAVLTVLQALGFTPRDMRASPDGATAEVHLLTCPYLELVRKHPDTMCRLHAGIIRGVLRQAGEPDDAVVLEPFAAPGACVVRFSGTGPKPRRER